jgi:hypothetical protein
MLSRRPRHPSLTAERRTDETVYCRIVIPVPVPLTRLAAHQISNSHQGWGFEGEPPKDAWDGCEAAVAAALNALNIAVPEQTGAPRLRM